VLEPGLEPRTAASKLCSFLRCPELTGHVRVSLLCVRLFYIGLGWGLYRILSYLVFCFLGCGVSASSGSPIFCPPNCPAAGKFQCKAFPAFQQQCLASHTVPRCLCTLKVVRGRSELEWSPFLERCLVLQDRGGGVPDVIVPELCCSPFLLDQALIYPEGHGDGFSTLEPPSLLGI
jgi:hypothetical protein